MSAVRVPDVLLRISPKNLERFQSLAVAGAGRGRAAPLPYTFTRADASTCATYWDSAGIVRLASANNLRVDDYGPYYEQGLVDSAGLPLHGIRLEGTRTNVVLWNRDLTNAAWVKTNITAAKDQTGIDGVASSASKITASAGNGTCLQSITLGSSLRRQTAFVKRITGTGVIEMTTDNGGTWTAITVTSTTAWARRSIPAQTLANPTVGFRIVTSGDAIAVDFAQNETGAFESNPIATTTAAVTRAADSLTVPFNFGPMDATVLVRLARPIHADAAGSIIIFPGLFDLGNNVTTYWRGYYVDSTRTVTGNIVSGTSPSVSQSLPAGATQIYTYQFKDMGTSPRMALDVGAGYGGFSGAASMPMPVFGSQTLRLGNILGASTSQLYGCLTDFQVQRGLFTYAEAIAVP